MAAFPGAGGGLKWFSVLRYRDFRWLILSSSLWFASRWMEMAVLGWMVLELTNSPFMVGVVGALRWGGWLLAPFSGTIADRLSRRRLLLLAQGTNTLIAAILLALQLSGRLEMELLFPLVFLGSITTGLDFPARNALVVDVVGKEELTNAVALNRAAADVPSLVGPLLGGSLVEFMGFGAAFGAMVFFNLINLGALLLMRDNPTPTPGKAARESVWQELGEGWRLCQGDRALLAALGLALLANLLIFPATHTLLPVFARDVLGVGAAGYGVLAGALGAGGLMASVGLAMLMANYRGKLLAASFLLWPWVIVIFATLPFFYLSLSLLIVAGISQAVAMVTSTAFLLERVSPGMRGRIMGLRGLVIASLPLGNLGVGALTSALGAIPALLIFGLAAALSMAAVALGSRGLRQWR